jgi:hypothetical protein
VLRWLAALDDFHTLVYPRGGLMSRFAKRKSASRTSAGNATSIAVATGGFDVPALRAASADVVFEDLSDANAFLRVIE